MKKYFYQLPKGTKFKYHGRVFIKTQVLHQIVKYSYREVNEYDENPLALPKNAVSLHTGLATNVKLNAKVDV